MAMKKEIRELRSALLDLTGVLNRPQPDAALIAAAGVDLDRALFPLLARVERLGPLGIVELAELVGRDYTTVSRQISKLESIGLVERCASPDDKRVRAAIITDRGRQITESLDTARQKIIEKLLAEWDPKDVRNLVVLLRRFADDALGWVKTLS
jgi:DNA-binding MarR family transcriptional regulator